LSIGHRKPGGKGTKAFERGNKKEGEKRKKVGTADVWGRRGQKRKKKAVLFGREIPYASSGMEGGGEREPTMLVRKKKEGNDQKILIPGKNKTWEGESPSTSGPVEGGEGKRSRSRLRGVTF